MLGVKYLCYCKTILIIILFLIPAGDSDEGAPKRPLAELSQSSQEDVAAKKARVIEQEDQPENATAET